MPTKCCVPGCTSNYKSGKRCTVYTFPKEEAEIDSWMKALPIAAKKATAYMGVCRKHWPDDARMKQAGRHMRPIDPPSVFQGWPSSSLRLSAS
uniref:THAP-type domain-containing protein n=1 Tax=Macrostomum lignano TaxID=282301 RepID=A0A1I8IQ90_9PLAT